MDIKSNSNTIVPPPPTDTQKGDLKLGTAMVDAKNNSL